MNKKETGHNRHCVGHSVSLRCCAVVICGLLAMNAMASEDKPLQAAKQGKAKSVIEIWLWGGSSQLETFDPKPNAGDDYNGGFKAIPTNVLGMEISEFLPKLAKQAEKYSLIRSMTHGITGHEKIIFHFKIKPSRGNRCHAVRGFVCRGVLSRLWAAGNAANHNC